MGLFALLVLVLDFLQYVAGYVNALGTYRRAEKEKRDEAKYNPRWLSYRLRTVFFWDKIGAVVGTSIYLFIVTAPRLF